MSEEAFESLRIILVVIMVVLRIAVMPFFLQSFLNVAQDKLIEQRKDAGRILNTDLQKKVSHKSSHSHLNLRLYSCYYLIGLLRKNSKA